MCLKKTTRKIAIILALDDSSSKIERTIVAKIYEIKKPSLRWFVFEYKCFVEVFY